MLENRANSSGRQIHLAVARIPTGSRSPKPDPLFLLAGGPGQSAIETFVPLLDSFSAVLQNRDIVIVDQRGTGSSNALTCPSSDFEKDLSNGDLSASNRADLIQRCLQQLNGDPRYYTTADYIQDLEQIRITLGYNKINLLGVSYGTRAALAYSRAYPDRVRSMILDGIAPLDWPLGMDASQNAQQAIDALFLRCEHDPACQSAFPYFREEFHSLFAALDRQPAQVTLPDPVSGEPIRLTLTHASAANAIYMLSYSSQTSALIPLLVHTAVAGGDYTRLAAQYLILRQKSLSSVTDGLYLSVVCAEDVPYYSSQSQSTQSPASYLPDGTSQLKMECLEWPHAVENTASRQPVQSNVPALLVSGSADPVTPPQNAELAARFLPNSLNLVVNDMGHSIFYLGCLPRIESDFLDRGSIAGLNTTCIDGMHPDPFFLSFSGPTP